LAVGISLARCFTKPNQRRGKILSNAVAVNIKTAKFEFGGGIILLRRFAKPVRRGLVIRRNAIAGGVYDPEPKLRAGDTVIGKRPPISQRRLVIAALIRGRPIRI
jgi:hypothetical protein